MSKLTPQDEKCIQEWIRNGGKQSDAFEFAFPDKVKNWKKKTVHEKASVFFRSDKIQARINEILKTAQEQTQIDANWVLEASKRLHDKCIQDVKPVLTKSGEHVTGENIETGEEGLLYTFNASGAAKAIDLVGKHVSVQAFNEKTTVEIVDKASILEKARKRAKS